MTKPIPEWCERAAREVAPVLVRHGDESQAAAIIAEEHEKGCIVHENQVNTELARLVLGMGAEDLLPILYDYKQMRDLARKFLTED